jgi:hypothetical protein
VPTAKLVAVALRLVELVISVRLPVALTLALTKVAPDGITSVTVTFVAALGPALTTNKV